MMGRVRGGGLSEPDVKEADDSGLRGGRAAGSRAPATVLTGRTLGPTLLSMTTVGFDVMHTLKRTSS
jgi:hypothetical protein